MDYLNVKLLHVLSSTVLFGTGIGSAFYLLVATQSRDVRFIAGVTRWVVRAVWLFTATAAVLQPATGLWLVYKAGFALSARWLAWSITVYMEALHAGCPWCGCKCACATWLRRPRATGTRCRRPIGACLAGGWCWAFQRCSHS